MKLRPDRGEEMHTRRFGIRVLVLRTPDGRPFLTRWRLIDGTRFCVYLHQVSLPDPGIDLHDHPWSFATFILSGGYTEEHTDARRAPALAAIAEEWPLTCTHGEPRTWRAWSWHRVRPHKAHRITAVRPHTWTLCFVGRKFRSWGFFLPDGWVDFREYNYDLRRPCTVEQS